MNLDALRCFCAIVDTHSFRLAAERIHRSQPAVSQQLKALEREVGHALLDRKRGEPTPAGRLLYKRAQQVLGAADSMARELADFDESLTQELRVGTSDTTALYVLPPHVRRFAKAMPHTRLVLVNRSSGAISERVLRGELDMGIVTLPMRHPALEEEELFQQRLVLVAPKAHPLARRKRITLSALREESMLLLDANTRTGALLREHFREAGFTPQVVLDSGSFEVIKRYTAEGIGLSFLPEDVVGSEDKGLATVTIPGLPRVPIGVIRRKGAYLSKAEQAFLRLLRE